MREAMIMETNKFVKRDRANLSPPYVGYNAHLAALENLRQHGIPANVASSKEVQGDLPDVTYSQVMRAWRYLGLITTDGEPEEFLRHLVHADAKNRPLVLQDVLESSYLFLLGPDAEPINWADVTMQQIRNKFQDEGVQGKSIRRSAYFFARMVYDAGYPIPMKVIGDKAVMENEVGSMIGQASGKTNVTGVLTPSTIIQKPLSPQVRDNTQIGAMLLSKLPSFDPEWMRDERKAWFDSFNLVARIVEREQKPEA
jgi:hypothetical protein